MFQASNWALKTSRWFKKIIQEEAKEEWRLDQSVETREVVAPMENCNCTRTLQGRFPRVGAESDSTCSKDTFLRGQGQKIIGFSFYGNPNSTKSKSRKYFQVSLSKVK